MPGRTFESDEDRLAHELLRRLDEQDDADARGAALLIREVMENLITLRKVVTDYPSLLKPYRVAGRDRNVHTLVQAICDSNPYTIEAHMPTRAVVGRAYLVAKINLFRTLLRIARHSLVGASDASLEPELTRLLRVLITTLIAEDILVAIASDVRAETELRRKAVYLLVDLWEHRQARTVQDFFPLLDSVWEAKTRVTISYGTLSGTAEILSLMREGCDPEVIDYFTREQISEDERQALLELVFNATYEELQTMRRWMSRHRKDVLAPKDVARIFNVPEARLHQTISNTQDMFFTFRERQVNAYHRNLHDLPGPKKTAEEYLMIYYLRQTDIRPPQELRPSTPPEP
jgi:hypothetical protein